MPTDGTAINWGGIEDAKISLVPDVPGAKPTSYLGFCVTEVGESYTVDNEMVIDITGFGNGRDSNWKYTLAAKPTTGCLSRIII